MYLLAGVFIKRLIAFLIMLAGLAFWMTGPLISKAPVSPAKKSPTQMSLHPPLLFQQNQGQLLQGVNFSTQYEATLAYLSAHEAQHRDTASGGWFRLKFAGSNPAAKMLSEKPLPTKFNYFLGNQPDKWRTNLSTYASCRTRNAYPGIDIVYHEGAGRLETDFVVAPGADPGQVQFQVETAQRHLAQEDGTAQEIPVGHSPAPPNPPLDSPSPHPLDRLSDRLSPQPQRRAGEGPAWYHHGRPVFRLRT